VHIETLFRKGKLQPPIVRALMEIQKKIRLIANEAERHAFCHEALANFVSVK